MLWYQAHRSNRIRIAEDRVVIAKQHTSGLDEHGLGRPIHGRCYRFVVKAGVVASHPVVPRSGVNLVSTSAADD